LRYLSEIRHSNFKAAHRRRSAILKRLLPFLLATAWTMPGWAPAQTTHQDHPPRTASAYIRALEDPGRGEWQKPQEVLAHLALKPGETIADVGAGSGYFTLPLARAVGPRGKVYAVDIDPQMLDYIRKRARQEHLANIETVLADPHDPKLAASSVDLIFICDTLHHISDRQTYFPLLARALKPGGKLVNIDFHKRDLPLGPPVEMKIPRLAMIAEAKAGGFHLVQEFDFLPYQYFLVFQR
jgi:SAM-dependent methyltransferase